ncbi:MAG: N-acetylgalactosamine 6-sulfate sulfatase, partial [Armatimonadota bacterium]|nr:N-acetylgalactosamine 6-sulfate sulfatase [Armatimonadota bacterium]
PPPLPGRSLVAAFAEDRPIPRDYLYWHHMSNRAVRVGDWKAVRLGPNRPIELYHLAKDVGETTDVAANHPDVVARAEQLFREARVDSPDFPVRPGRAGT